MYTAHGLEGPGYLRKLQAGEVEGMGLMLCIMWRETHLSPGVLLYLDGQLGISLRLHNVPTQWLSLVKCSLH